jgi:hypothetical protein
MFIRHERPGSFQHPLEKRLRDLFVAKSIKGSKVWLITQTIFAWLCALFFGYKTLAMLVPNASLQQKFQNPNPGDPRYSAAYVAGMWLGFFATPLLLALSVRWTRRDAQMESIEAAAG